MSKKHFRVSFIRQAKELWDVLAETEQEAIEKAKEQQGELSYVVHDVKKVEVEKVNK